MSKTLTILENEAREFMAKRLANENRVRDEVLSELTKLARQIEVIFKSHDNIRVSHLSIIIESDIKPLVNQFRQSFQRIMENSITGNMSEGYRNASRLIQLATGDSILVSENVPEIDDEETMEEILLLLLLYSEKLVDSLSDDLINALEKDLTNIYITSKNRNDNNTLNTILSGAVIAEYINATLKNIRDRADAISRTETNRALNHGGLFYYLKAQGLIPGLLVKWVEIPDRSLCRYCKERAESGTRYGIGVYHINDIQPPPLHPRCRCILVPYHQAWS